MLKKWFSIWQLLELRTLFLMDKCGPSKKKPAIEVCVQQYPGRVSWVMKMKFQALKTATFGMRIFQYQPSSLA